MNASSRNLTTFPELHSNFLDYSSYMPTAGAVSCLLFVLPVNIYVVCLIVQGRGKGLAAELFPLCQAVTEIVLCVTSEVFPLNQFIFPNRLARAQLLFTALLTVGRPTFQSFICVERFLAVVYPVTFLRFRPLRYRLACSAGAWMLVLCASGVSFTNTFEVVYGLFSLSLVLTLVKLFCALAILRVLKQPGPVGREADGANQAKVKAFNIISVILMSDLVTYTGVVILLGLQKYLSTMQIRVSTSIIFYIMTTTGIIHPFHYLHRVGKLPCCMGHLQM